MEYIDFKTFTNTDAYRFGLTVVSIIEKEKLKPVRIRVVKDGDIVFQYMMEGKKGDLWLNKKQRTVEKTHQSSLYVFDHQDDYKELDEETYAICGGGYPLFINGEYHGVLIVSGLRHDEDHALILRALKEMEK